MKDQIRKYILFAGVAAAALAIVLYLPQIIGGVKSVFGMLKPLIVGGVIAFVLNVPMRMFESLLETVSKKFKKPMKEKSIQNISLFLSILVVGLILILVVSILIPNLVITILAIASVTQAELPSFIENIQKIHLPIEQLNKIIESIDLNSIVSTIQNFVTSKIGSSFSGLLSLTSSTIGGVTSGLIGFIIAVYILLDKKKVGNQTHRIMKAWLPEKACQFLLRVASLISDTYRKFFTGQCLEACIVGGLLFITLSLCRIPYASLIAILAAILSFIPYIGSLIACFAGALFIVVINPYQALLEIVVYQIVQFVEGQFIYPRVVGSSVGLPPLLTLLAALFGGIMFGLIGMIFFIPFVAVFYTLIKEAVDSRLKEKNIDTSDPEHNAGS